MKTIMQENYGPWKLEKWDWYFVIFNSTDQSVKALSFNRIEPLETFLTEFDLIWRLNILQAKNIIRKRKFA